MQLSAGEHVPPHTSIKSRRNLALLLTPAGSGAIAVVRIAGAGVSDFLRAHFSKTAGLGRCVHGTLAEGSRIIDDPVVVLLPDERGADINVHGGPWVVQSVFDLAAKAGFEVVEPRSAAALELLDGATLIEREIAAAMPAARTELSLRVLLAQAQAWEGFDAGTWQRTEIESILRDESLLHLLNPPRVAVVGAPNVGKSTLANQLFGQERSITADLAGTTRDWVGEIANVDGLAVMLVDTPGLRTTDDAIERTAIERSRAEIESAELVVLVLDATRALDGKQRGLFSAYPGAMVVKNKSDRGAAWEDRSLGAIHCVATTGQGLTELRNAIAAHFGCAAMEMDRPRWWTPRQREILERRLADYSPDVVVGDEQNHRR